MVDKPVPPAKFTSAPVRIQVDEAGPGDLCRPPWGSYVAWFCLGWFCPLPAAFCIGRKMNEKKPFLKYLVPGKLINVSGDQHKLCSVTVSQINFARF